MSVCRGEAPDAAVGDFFAISWNEVVAGLWAVSFSPCKCDRPCNRRGVRRVAGIGIRLTQAASPMRATVSDASKH
jgi:hypothetical protein